MLSIHQKRQILKQAHIVTKLQYGKLWALVYFTDSKGSQRHVWEDLSHTDIHEYLLESDVLKMSL